eukprot:TRINITY_DN1604_c0_g1_i7.p1 TRINITY_DN1604_c0_g1~~TRINITY_DN1604_c0_g1_i7.p1  ORF type:complete len:242 (+),score=43.29 TRINITY_DN1604_c0_g1_i7:92-727(+)
MARMIAATAVALLAAREASAATCVTATEGSCRLFGCDPKRGVTDCVSGQCVCSPGYCQVNGKCMKGCEQHTPGSCRIFGCSSKRGVTDCVGGKCVCAPGTCAENGVCYDVCPRSTGGSCSWGSCSSSRGKTECVHGSCLCRPGDCSVGGKCVTPETINEVESLPVSDQSLAPFFAAGAACAAASVAVTYFAWKVAGRIQASLDEPLLATEA